MILKKGGDGAHHKFNKDKFNKQQRERWEASKHNKPQMPTEKPQATAKPGSMPEAIMGERRPYGQDALMAPKPKPLGMKCENGIIFHWLGCPTCECAPDNLCRDVRCHDNHYCHHFNHEDSNMIRGYCVHESYIESEGLHHHRHHRMGKVCLMVGIAVFLIVAIIVSVCCIKRGINRRNALKTAAVVPPITINCPAYPEKQAPAYFITPIVEEEKVVPTDFVEPETMENAPPGYTSRTISVASLRDNEKKMEMPEAC